MPTIVNCSSRKDYTVSPVRARIVDAANDAWYFVHLPSQVTNRQIVGIITGTGNQNIGFTDISLL
jgi:hypothetical protein